MKFKDILPNSIYRVQGQYGIRGYIRTGDTVTAVPSYGEPREGKRNTHLLLTIDRYDIIHRDGEEYTREWDYVDADGDERSEDDRYVDQVEVLRWVDHGKSRHGVVHGDEGLDLTFQPEPFVTEIGDLSRPYLWDLRDLLTGDSIPADIAQQVGDHLAAYDAWEAATEAEEKRTDYEVPDEWYEANPEPEIQKAELAETLKAEWGTHNFRHVTSHRYSWKPTRSTVDWGGRVTLSKVDGPYTEADLAAARLIDKAESAEREARYAAEREVREIAERKAEAFLVTALAEAPDALVENTDNGFDRKVERARLLGRSDWSLDHSYRDEVNTETPDGGNLIGLKASTLAAITYAWQQTFGDASWADISAGVYERFHASEEVLHIAVDVPDNEEVEVTAERVARYLPGNYEVVDAGDAGWDGQVLVKGTDVAGWTAADYVLPRLASGLLTATVYSMSRKAVSA